VEEGNPMKTIRTNLIVKVAIFLLLCIVIVFWSFQAIGEEWTAEQKEVWTSVQANWETIKKGDVEAALAMKHDDMVAWYNSNPEPLRKELMKQSYLNWFNYDKLVSYKLRLLTINIFNNVANVFYLYKYEGEKFSNRGRVFETWVKQDNKWLAIGSFDSSCEYLPRCPHVW
jgi:uncharacterized membrane protein YwzB